MAHQVKFITKPRGHNWLQELPSGNLLLSDYYDFIEFDFINHKVIKTWPLNLKTDQKFFINNNGTCVLGIFKKNDDIYLFNYHLVYQEFLYQVPILFPQGFSNSVFDIYFFVYEPKHNLILIGENADFDIFDVPTGKLVREIRLQNYLYSHNFVGIGSVHLESPDNLIMLGSGPNYDGTSPKLIKHSLSNQSSKLNELQFSFGLSTLFKFNQELYSVAKFGKSLDPNNQSVYSDYNPQYDPTVILKLNKETLSYSECAISSLDRIFEMIAVENKKILFGYRYLEFGRYPLASKIVFELEIWNFNFSQIIKRIELRTHINENSLLFKLKDNKVAFITLDDQIEIIELNC